MHNGFAHYSDTTGHHMAGGSGIGGFGVVWMILWLALIVLGVFSLVRWLGSDSPKGSETPQDIARKRYAKGEIDEKEYKKLLKDLHK